MSEHTNTTDHDYGQTDPARMPKIGGMMGLRQRDELDRAIKPIMAQQIGGALPSNTSPRPETPLEARLAGLHHVVGRCERLIVQAADRLSPVLAVRGPSDPGPGAAVSRSIDAATPSPMEAALASMETRLIIAGDELETLLDRLRV